ncbi:MAG: flagellar FlbD family protein [Nocardioidaceae bacterium]
MITLTRLTGAPFALNPDLIERVDCTPDTVITLVDGTKYLVCESLQDVVDLALEYRARVVAGASSYEHQDTSASRRTRLTAVPGVAATAADRAADPAEEDPLPEDDLDDVDDDLDDDDVDDLADRASGAWRARQSPRPGRDRSVISLEPRTI